MGQNPDTGAAIDTGLFDPASLTEGTWVPFANYCHTFILKAESTYFLRKERIIEASVCDKEFDRAAKFLSVPGPAQWWAAGARTQFTDEFVSMIERRVGQSRNMQVYDFTPGKGFHPLAETENSLDE
jgi:hypothetical protein